MSDKLVEKVARALCADNFMQVQGNPTTEATINEAWRDDISGAKAAIHAVFDAIAEPSEAQINAIHSIHRPGWDVAWHTVWTTMIAALREEMESEPIG